MNMTKLEKNLFAKRKFKIVSCWSLYLSNVVCMYV